MNILHAARHQYMVSSAVARHIPLAAHWNRLPHPHPLEWTHHRGRPGFDAGTEFCGACREGHESRKSFVAH